MVNAVILDFYGVIFDPTTHQPMLGLEDFLRLLQTHQLPCAIASSSDSCSIQEFLEEHQLAAYIKVVIGADQVLALKPDPECYLSVIKYLQVTPRQCVIVDDSAAPLENAKLAGFQTIYFHNELADFTAIAKILALE